MANEKTVAEQMLLIDPNGFEGFFDERGDWHGRCPNCGEDEIDGGRCHYCGKEV